MKNKVLVVTDNGLLYNGVKEILLKDFSDLMPLFDFKRSKSSTKKNFYTDGIEALDEIDVKKEYTFIIKNYKLVLSLHCKQIFPNELINNILCINIHPGYNPYNRGWYPQVFAIINQTRLGATIHIMDEKIDNGAIIDRQEVTIKSCDTSKEAYEAVLEVELELFRKNIRNIILGNFSTIPPEFEGEYHSIDDYRQLCELDLNKIDSYKNTINILRALSHGDYNNAYFYDENGDKIFVKIQLIKEKHFQAKSKEPN